MTEAVQESLTPIERAIVCFSISGGLCSEYLNEDIEALIDDRAALLARVAELEAALRQCVAELKAVELGSTGGVPNAIFALIPEALESARHALGASQ